MTGPDHYREAEALLAMATDPNDPRAPFKDRDALIRAAGVHATLALAAATARQAIHAHFGGDPGDDRQWAQAVFP